MIVSIGTQKTFDRTFHDFKKILKQIQCTRHIPQHNQGIIWKTTASIILNRDVLKAFSLYPGPEKDAQSHTAIQYYLGSFKHSHEASKENQRNTNFGGCQMILVCKW